MGVGGENVKGSQGGEDDGNGDKADAGANDGRSITGEGRRRPGGMGEVEREDIKECIGDLGPIQPWKVQLQNRRTGEPVVQDNKGKGKGSRGGSVSLLGLGLTT